MGSPNHRYTWATLNELNVLHICIFTNVGIFNENNQRRGQVIGKEQKDTGTGGGLRGMEIMQIQYSCTKFKKILSSRNLLFKHKITNEGRIIGQGHFTNEKLSFYLIHHYTTFYVTGRKIIY